jgi:hypothetical protein
MDKKQSFERQIRALENQIYRLKNWAWVFVFIGIGIFIACVFYLFFNDKAKINEVGDFIGGVVGSLWALAGLFFIYIAFIGQKVEIKLQQEDLTLTREELQKTKEVFKQQSRIMLNQQSDTTFFNLLENHRKLIDSFKKGNRNYYDNNSLVSGGLGYNVNNYNVEIISGYDILEAIYIKVQLYFKKYSEYLKSNNIFESEITKTNPIDFISSFPEIKMLFDEVLNILNFVDKNFGENDKQFYFNTLSSNLNTEEKFLIEAYNFNISLASSSLCYFGIYNSNNFENFLLDNYLTPKEILIKGEYKGVKSLDIDNNLKDDMRLILDEPSDYSKIDFYFIDNENKSIKPIETIFKVEKEIHISRILLKITEECFNDEFFERIDRKRERESFDILIKSTLKLSLTKIFYQYNIGVYCELNKSGFNFYFDREKNINDWVKDCFN